MATTVNKYAKLQNDNFTSSSSSSSTTHLAETSSINGESLANVLSYKGQMLDIASFRATLQGNANLEELDLRSTVLARGTKATEILACIKKDGAQLQRIYLGDTSWMKDVWGTYKTSASDDVIDLYISIFQILVFPLKDNEGKQASFEEIIRWAECVLDAPEECRKKAFSLFFSSFPQIEKIDCRDPGIEKVPSSTFFFSRGQEQEEKGISDTDLESLLAAIPKRYRKLILDLSSCSRLTGKALGLLHAKKEKLLSIDLFGNRWLRDVPVQDFKALGTLVRLGDPNKQAVAAEELFSWIRSYPTKAGAEGAIKAFFAAHPKVTSLNLAKSQVTTEELEYILDQIGSSLVEIDLSETPNLGYSALTALGKCTPLQRVILSGNRWMQQIWKADLNYDAKVKNLLLKVVYPLKTEGVATLREVYGWHKLLQGERQNFGKACALLFAKFPNVALRCISCTTTNGEIDELLEAWPFGKKAPMSGELSLISLGGCDKGLFSIVNQRVPYLKTLYVDEVDGVFSSAWIRQLPAAMGASLFQSLALQSGPDKGTLSYEMVQKWKWLTEKFHTGNKALLFDWSIEQLFERYKGVAITKLDFSNSLITDNELEKILQKYRATYPRESVALDLTGCRNLTENSFSLVHKHCSGKVTFLSVSENTPLARGIMADHMDAFWQQLTFAPSDAISKGKILCSEFFRWCALMGKNGDFEASCDRFFIRFPGVTTFDLEGMEADEARLITFFTKWRAHLAKNPVFISLDLSCSQSLSVEGVGKLHLQLSDSMQKVNLSGNRKITDQALAQLIQAAQLTEIGIEGCTALSDEMVGACESLLPSFKTNGRMVTVSADKLPATEAECTSYFLHHPLIQKMNLSSDSIDDLRLACIMQAWKEARSRWEKMVWPQLITDDPRQMTSRAEKCNLLLNRCPHLSRDCFSILQECCSGIDLIDLSENEWVINAGIERLEERGEPIELNVYGCRSLTKDVEGRLRTVRLLQPRWTTPVVGESMITFLQVAHHSCVLRPIKERAEMIVELFNSFYEKVWPLIPPVLSNIQEKQFSVPLSEWSSKVEQLLPHRREALAVLIGKDPLKIQGAQGVAEACKVLAQEIKVILDRVIEDSTSTRGDKGLNVDTLIESLSSQKAKEEKQDLASFFSRLEKAIEASLFLLDISANTPQSPILEARQIEKVSKSAPIDIGAGRKEIEKKALMAYLALFPEHGWKLEAPFVYRAVDPLALPSILPDPKEKGKSITLATWMEREGFESSLGMRGELIDAWLKNWTGKVETLVDTYDTTANKESWGLEWNRWTVGYGGINLPATKVQCEEIHRQIETAVEKQREFLYSFAFSNQIMNSFQFATKIDLGKGGITLWQLEGILRSISNRKIQLLNLSYNPLISAEGLRNVMGSFDPPLKIENLHLDGNLWVNNQLVSELQTHAEWISVEGCYHYRPLKEGRSDRLETDKSQFAFLREDFVEVRTLGDDSRIAMSDDETSQHTFHITKIRGLLPTDGDLAKRYLSTILAQGSMPKKISGAGSDVDDKELSFLVQALQKKLENIGQTFIDLDLSKCDHLTPNSFQEIAPLRGRLSSLNLSGNFWVGGKEKVEELVPGGDGEESRTVLRSKWVLEKLAPHSRGLRELDLTDCSNLFLLEVDAFVDAFFREREQELLIDLELPLKLLGIENPDALLATSADSKAVASYKEKISTFKKQRNQLSFSIATVKTGGMPCFVLLHRGEKYSEKLHSALLK